MTTRHFWPAVVEYDRGRGKGNAVFIAAVVEAAGVHDPVHTVHLPSPEGSSPRLPYFIERGNAVLEAENRIRREFMPWPTPEEVAAALHDLVEAQNYLHLRQQDNTDYANTLARAQEIVRRLQAHAG